MTRIFVLAVVLWFHSAIQAAESLLHSFQRQTLSTEYFCEGAGFGDVSHDGKPDIVAGPFWYAGPDFKTKHEIYPPKPQNRNRYADNFFSFVYDFNGDGWGDVLRVGFPGTPAIVFENPKGAKGHWKRHQVFDWVGNESPTLTNLVGDARPELVCTKRGQFGYVTVDWKNPFGEWTFHAVSGAITSQKFGHGLGVGDVNGDGRPDIIHKDGWFAQPRSDQEAWKAHKFTFAPRGGAQMFAYDVDGDGDNDIITSLAAHEFGLAWFEQQKSDGGITFKKHLIMGSTRRENKYGINFSELHATGLHDIDGDGLKDIVTGKTYWSHHKQSPQWDAGAVVYWFKLVRGKDGVDFVPQRADTDSGLGRQVSIGDVTGNGLPDIVSAGMKGTHVLRHATRNVTAAEYAKAQSKKFVPAPLPKGILPKGKDGQALNLDFEKGTLADWTAKLTPAALAQLQSHPNEWYARHARRVLQERLAKLHSQWATVSPDAKQSAAAWQQTRDHTFDIVDPILKDQLAIGGKGGKDKTTALRLRSLWCLHVIEGLNEADLLALLKDRDAMLRGWAIQLLAKTKIPKIRQNITRRLASK